jgi:hypothetical protein
MDTSLEPAESLQIPVEIAYAKADQQCVLSLKVPNGCTLLSAVQQSGMLERFPEIDLQQATFGVFGVLVKQQYSRLLSAGERVEIYRPLTLDPKERRRQLAKAKLRAANKARDAKARAARLARGLLPGRSSL